MSQLRDTQIGSRPAKTGGPENSSGSSPLRVFLIGAVIIVVVVAVLLAAIRIFLFPVLEANSEGAREVATAQAQLATARTQEALTPVATATSFATATAQSTVSPTPLATAAPVAAAQTVPAPAGLPVTGETPVAVAVASPPILATPTAEQAAELAAAYKNYFDVTSEALLNLDPSLLDTVAAGQELAALQQDIEEDQAQGRVLDTNVEHEQVYVLGVQGDEADIADRYRDSSVYVDPNTHLPLPGQVAPASPDAAPAVSVIYHLQRIDGTWKVVSGERFVPQGSQ